MSDDKKKKRAYGDVSERNRKYFKHLEKKKEPGILDILTDYPPDDGLMFGGHIEIDGERLEIEVDWTGTEDGDDDDETETEETPSE